MKTPKYAEQLNSVNTELDEWLEKNGIPIDMNQRNDGGTRISCIDCK